MKFFILEPEVAGGFGPETILDHDTHPPRPTIFHYQFHGWLGDPIVETVANYIVTLPLKKRMEDISASGIVFNDVKISRSIEFKDLYPKRTLPSFKWMQIFGTAGRDDFGLSEDHRLVVSDRVLAILKDEGMKNCEIESYTKH